MGCAKVQSMAIYGFQVPSLLELLSSLPTYLTYMYSVNVSWSAGTVSIGLLLKAQGSGGAPRDTFDAHGIHGCHGAMQRFNNSYGSDPKTASCPNAEKLWVSLLHTFSAQLDCSNYKATTKQIEFHHFSI
jgi:hypothetical protein